MPGTPLEIALNELLFALYETQECRSRPVESTECNTCPYLKACTGIQEILQSL